MIVMKYNTCIIYHITIVIHIFRFLMKRGVYWFYHNDVYSGYLFFYVYNYGFDQNDCSDDIYLGSLLIGNFVQLVL